MSTEQLTIHAIGAEGDGIARGEAGPIFVPFTLPGEEVAVARVKNQATALSWSKLSPDRREPPCKHFGPEGVGGACGGCSLQHWADEPYQAYKRDLVIQALRQNRIETDVRPLIACAPGERRRVTMSGRPTDKGLMLGFMQAGSHHIVPVEECPIAHAGIVSRLPAIRRIAGSLASGAEPFRVTIQLTAAGLDLAFAEMKKPDQKKRQAAIDLCLKEKGVGRISVADEILVEPQKPVILFDQIPVVLPPGGFMQATERAEQAMADLVLAHVGKAKRVADLFAGCGTFSLRLARKAHVHAVEFDGPALAALDHAARNTQGLKPVSIERRDLFRRPMQPMDLKQIDALVFDPPRAGAEAQVRELPRSKVARIAAVSCNPTTLARDLAILIEGGFKLKSVTPIDQFLWSSHVEAVALLER